MNIFWHELRKNRRAALLWILALCGTLFLFLLMYPAMVEEGDAYLKILEGYPPELLAALSINAKLLLTFEGFLSYVDLYLFLALAVLAMNLGLRLLGKEISGKTADFLLTKPRRRFALFTPKLLSGLSILLVTNLFLLLTATLAEALLKEGPRDLRLLLFLQLAGFLLSLLFYAFGAFLGVLLRKIRFTVSLALSTVFGFFALAMVSQILDKAYLTWFTPFRYFELMPILENRHLDGPYLLLSLLLTVFFTGAAYALLERREIHA